MSCRFNLVVEHWHVSGEIFLAEIPARKYQARVGGKIIYHDSCRQCRRLPAVRNRTLCDSCLSKAREYASKCRKLNMTDGVCIRAYSHGPVVPGEIYCRKCFDKAETNRGGVALFGRERVRTMQNCARVFRECGDDAGAVLLESVANWIASGYKDSDAPMPERLRKRGKT